MAELLSQSLPFTVTVLEGPLSVLSIQPGQPAGVVSLRGRAMPYAPFTLESEQRIKTTWYPGNPKATQQVMGVTEKPTTITGIWKDRYIGDGVSRFLAKVFENIGRSAPQLQVTWGTGATSTDVGGGGTVGEPLVRYGLLKRWKFSHNIPQQVPFELEFEWNGLEQASIPAVTVTGQVTYKESLNDISRSVEDATAFAQAMRDVNGKLGLPLSTIRNLNQNLDQANASLRSVNAAANTIAGLRTIPFQVTQQLVNAASLAGTAMNSLRDTFESLPLPKLVPDDQPISYLNFAGNRLEVLGKASEANDKAVRGSGSLAQEQSPNIVAQIRAPAGTDLREIALQQYGDPDGWITIANFNNFPDSRVPMPPSGPSDVTGVPIQIPELRTGPQGDLSLGC